MYCLTLLIGGQFLTLYFWEWAAYLFGFSSIIINALWLLTTFREKPMLSGGRELTENLQKCDECVNYLPVKRRGKVTVYIGLPLLGVMLMMMGYMIRDHQLATNTHTYFDVQVLDKYSDTKYLLQPARMQPWISKPCQPIDLTPGHTMKFYTYEQMLVPDCHRVKAFEFYINNKGERVNASIQMR